MSNIEVAQTIMDQLEQSFHMVVMNHNISIFSYIGAKTFVYDSTSLMFQVPNRKKIIIELNGADLYDVSLYNLKRFEYEKQVKDVYADNLKNTVFKLLGVN